MAQALDQIQICNVRRTWAFSLDLGEWEQLRCVFSSQRQHHGFVVLQASGWLHRSFQGDGGHPQTRGASQALARQYAERDQGTRAVLETDVLVLIREFIDGSLFDYTSYARFYDLFEKRAGAWRIAEWNCIYDKDRLDPVAPVGDAVCVQAASRAGRGGKRVCIHEAAPIQAGPNHSESVVIRDTEGERNLRRRGASWLGWRGGIKCRCESFSWARRISRCRR